MLPQPPAGRRVAREVTRQNAAMAQSPNAEENGPMGLLKRSANGLGSSYPQSPNQSSDTLRSTPPAPVPLAREEDNAYAPQKPGALDSHGRATPVNKPINDEDQLDIPAFLRRQA